MLSTHWTGLMQFLDDGRLALDNNMVERAIRPVRPRPQEPPFAGAEAVGSLGRSSQR